MGRTNPAGGILVVRINPSTVLISLPAIFRGIRLNPLEPANVSYLLWILQGFLVVTAVLVISFGRLGDAVGRVRIYNPGFSLFTPRSLGLSLGYTPGRGAALPIILLRVPPGGGRPTILPNPPPLLTPPLPPPP